MNIFRKHDYFWKDQHFSKSGTFLEAPKRKFEHLSDLRTNFEKGNIFINPNPTISLVIVDVVRFIHPIRPLLRRILEDLGCIKVPIVIQ